MAFRRYGHNTLENNEGSRKMSFKGMFIGFALVALFAFSMIAFESSLTRQNNANSSLLDNEDLNLNDTYSNLESSLDDFQDIAQSQRTNFERDFPLAGFGELIIFAVFSMGRVFTNLLVGVFNILVTPLVVIIGLDPIVLGVITSIFVLTMILVVWRLVKRG
jgi:hypothetical protein